MDERDRKRELTRGDERRFPLTWLEDAPSTPPLSAWSRLRMVMDGLVLLLRGAVAATTQRRKGAHPDWERRRRELEARELRVETARRELENKQQGLEPEWSRVFAELDRIRDGWGALGRDHPPALGAEELNLPDLSQRILFLELLWDRLMLRDAAEQREQAMVARAWERLATSLAESVEEGRTAGLLENDWRALTRRLRDLERRWSLHCKSKRMLLAEQDILLAHQRMHDAETRLKTLLEQVRRGLPESDVPARTAEEISALHRALEEQRRETAAAMGQAGAWKEEAERLAHVVAGLRGEAEASKSGLAALDARTKSLEAEASALRSEGASASEACDALRREASEWRLRADTATAEIQSLRSENRRRGELMAGLETESGRWKAQAGALQARLEEELRRFQSLDGMVKDHAERAAEAAGLRRALAEAVAASDRLETRLAEASAELLAARQDREHAAAEAAEARMAAAEADRRTRETLTSLVRDHRREADVLEGRLTALADQLHASKEDARRAQAAAEALRAERDRIVDDARAATDASRAERDRLREETQAALLAKEGLEARLAAAASQRDAAAERGEILRARAEALEEESLQMSHAAESATRRANDFAQRLAAASTAYETERRTAEEKSVELRKLKDEVLNLSETAKRHEEACIRLREALKQAEEELATARTRVPAPPAVTNPPSASGAEPAEAPLPSLQPTLEPGWGRILTTLDRSLTRAAARLRRLAAAATSEPSRLAARQAAGDVAQAQDVVTLVSEFHGDGAEDASPGRVDLALEEALSAWEPALRARGVSLVRRPAQRLAATCPRPEALRVAFYQVIRNAYEAMPTGGCLTVATSVDAAAGAVKVSFSDTGKGFTKAALGSLFAPFVTEKPGHLGLGLALARRAARRAEGDLEVSETPTGGALVTFRLPAEADLQSKR